MRINWIVYVSHLYIHTYMHIHRFRNRLSIKKYKHREREKILRIQKTRFKRIRVLNVLYSDRTKLRITQLKMYAADCSKRVSNSKFRWRVTLLTYGWLKPLRTFHFHLLIPLINLCKQEASRVLRGWLINQIDRS